MKILIETIRFGAIDYCHPHHGRHLAWGLDPVKKHIQQMSTRKVKNGNGKGKTNGTAPTFHFGSVESSNVPRGRKGKHRTMVARILEDLENREEDQAVRVPLSSLQGEKIQNLRSALNRVSRTRKLPIATSSDEKYLYVWNADPDGNGSGPQGNQA